MQIGGQSTRPGAKEIDSQTEIARVLPVVQTLAKEIPEAILSIDTFRGATAKAALEEGAAIVNDVSAGMWCEDLVPTITQTRATWIAMHTRGKPQVMMRHANYRDVPGQVGDELAQQIQLARSNGIRRWSIIADGGVGFAKEAEHNCALLRGWKDFKQRAGGYPTLLGLSRKAFLKKACSEGAPPSARDWATAGALGCTMSTGAVDMVRVHDASLADAVRAADNVFR